MHPSRAQLKKFQSVRKDNEIVVGTTAFLVYAPWFHKWKQACSADKSEAMTLEPIDNSNLLLNGELKPMLTEKIDFIILTEKLWKLVEDWYGGGPEIAVVIREHPKTHQLIPILHKWTFVFHWNDTTHEMQVDKYMSIGELKEIVCKELALEPAKTRLIDYWNQHIVRPLQDESQYIYEVGIVDTQDLLVDVQDESGRWKSRRERSTPLMRKNSSVSIGNAFGLLASVKSGRVGFVNLGNTCFFNSTVQALAHTDLLATLFLNFDWRKQINQSNKLSTEGHIANTFAELVYDIWRKDELVLNPGKLRDTLCQFAPRFADHQQHDAQEMLIFLLDGLHEDLNRVSKTVYSEGVEGDESCQEALAEASWRRHKLSNDSVIVDIFHGQLRSELICPICNYQCVVFDPYVSVTLPLPTEKMTSIRYFFIPWEKQKQRVFRKVHAFTTQEMENVKNDAVKQFGVKNLIVVYRDMILADFQVKLVPVLRKVEYFVFEVPDPNVLYTLVQVDVCFAKRNRAAFIDGPILIQSPRSVSQLQATCEKELAYFWKRSNLPAYDKCKEEKLATAADPEIFKKPKQKMVAVPIFSEIKRILESEVPGISTQAVRVILNPEYSRESEGFDWGSVMPYDRSSAINQQEDKLDMSLASCLKCFSSPDKLDRTSQWFCPRCRKLVRATAKLDIWSVPDVLIFHLKRFVVKDGTVKKVGAKIDYPCELEMSPYVSGPQKNESLKYSLYAIIQHLGTMNAGHYVSTIRSNDGEWWTFNDDAVYPTQDKNIHSEYAYVLMYKRTCENR